MAHGLHGEVAVSTPASPTGPSGLERIRTVIVDDHDDLGRVVQGRKCLQPSIRHTDDTNIGLDCGKRVVRGQHIVLRQRVEHRRLADVGQSDDADRDTHDPRVYGAVATQSHG